jgi:hypothetical protein
MLLLQELKPHHGGHSSTAPALYGNTDGGGGGASGPHGPPPPRPPPPPTGYGAPAGYGNPAPYGKNKGKKKVYGAAPALSCPTPYNPWTESIHMYHMGAPSNLGPRPGAPSPHPIAHGLTAFQ